MKRFVLTAILISLIICICYIAISIRGLPWKKEATAEELKKYVEEKYEINVSIKETYYNYGAYGATFVTDNNKSIEFNAEKYGDSIYFEYYAEALWVKEAKDALDPVLEESFTTLTIDEYGVHPLYGMGNVLNIGKEIPSYTEIDTGVGLFIHFKDEWTEKNEDHLVSEVFSFIKKCQSKGIKNISLRFSLRDNVLKDGKISSFFISIDSSGINEIKTEEDVKEYILIF
ncbi:hypothetical protein [Sporosarcina sp. UB5]|uniref:YfjL-like protein n=1 Tax=Sporosarcina sp. UB5 TaxID=3047463 RepID=UPI003D78C959